MTLSAVAQYSFLLMAFDVIKGQSRISDVPSDKAELKPGLEGSSWRIINDFEAFKSFYYKGFSDCDVLRQR